MMAIYNINYNAIGLLVIDDIDKFISMQENKYIFFKKSYYLFVSLYPGLLNTLNEFQSTYKEKNDIER